MTCLYFVIPCYNEQAVLPETAATLTRKLQTLIAAKKVSADSRILFVDDGSTDDTWKMLCDLYQTEPTVLGLKLSCNRGHQNALLAGLLTAAEKADAVVSMDADLQDDVNAVDAMLARYEAGCDVVYGVRSSRKKDSFFKRVTAEGYYRILRGMGAKIVFNHADFRLTSRRALQALAEYKEVNLFLRGTIPLLGFRSDVVAYERQERAAGESKYSLRKMLSLAWEGITSFSIRPIRFVSLLGVTALVVSLGMIVYFLIRHFSGETVSGWSSLAVSLWALGGLQLLGMGIVGEYVGKIYLESKHRPRYTIETFLDK